MSNRELTGIASELGGLVGPTSQGGIIEARQVFENVAPRVQTGIKQGDLSHPALALLPLIDQPEAGGAVEVPSFQTCQYRVIEPPA